MMKHLSLVTLDMAGTTVLDKHEVEACFAAACREMSMEVDEQWIRSVQGWSKKFVFETYWKERINPQTEAFAQKVDASYAAFKEILETHYTNNDVRPTEGCLEFFAFLRESGVKIALTTGFYRKVADIILEKLGWLEGLDSDYIGSGTSLIDLTVTSDQVERGRPAPDMIQLAMRKLNVSDPMRVAAIGDTPSDIQSGLNAGCGWVVGVTNGTHSADQLEGIGAHYLASSLSDAKTALEKSGLTAT